MIHTTGGKSDYLFKMKTSIVGKFLVLIYQVLLVVVTDTIFQTNLELLGCPMLQINFFTRKQNHKITHTIESQAFNLALHSLNKETAVKWIISINELSYTPSVKMLVFDTKGLPSFAD